MGALSSISIRNYRAFGESALVPLSPVTVVVGANNSGKSTLLGLPAFLANVLSHPNTEVASAFHRPALGERATDPANNLAVSWTGARGSYRFEWSLDRATNQVVQVAESLSDKSGRAAWNVDLASASKPSLITFPLNRQTVSLSIAMNGLRTLTGQAFQIPVDLPNAEVAQVQADLGAALAAVQPVLSAHLLKLELQALREDCDLGGVPSLHTSGRGAAAVLSKWKVTEAPEAEALNHFVRTSLPEVASVLAPTTAQGKARLAFRLKDGQVFDAADCSDGMLSFIGLCMHALSAAPGSLMMVEEPEHSIHPLRLHQYVDLLRRLSSERGAQFVVATHSPVLLNEFRDEPEAILLFSRSRRGTRVRRLSDVPELADTLADRDSGDPGKPGPWPGLMLQDGFFSEASE